MEIARDSQLLKTLPVGELPKMKLFLERITAPNVLQVSPQDLRFHGRPSVLILAFFRGCRGKRALGLPKRMRQQNR